MLEDERLSEEFYNYLNFMENNGLNMGKSQEKLLQDFMKKKFENELKDELAKYIQKILIWRKKEPEFSEITKDFISFSHENKDSDYDLCYGVCVNFIFIAASTFCGADQRQQNDIEALFEKYEEYLEKIFINSRFINQKSVLQFLIPQENMHTASLAMALLESIDVPDPNKDDGFENSIIKAYDAGGNVCFRNIKFNTYSSQDWNIPEDVKENINTDLYRIFKKYNKKIYNSIKKTGTYDFGEEYIKSYKKIQEGKSESINIVKISQQMAISILMGCNQENILDRYEKILAMLSVLDIVYGMTTNKKLAKRVYPTIKLDQREKFIFEGVAFADTLLCYCALKNHYGISDEMLLYNQKLEKEDIQKIIASYIASTDEDNEHFVKTEEYYQYLVAACNIVLLMKNYNALNMSFQTVVHKLHQSNQKRVDMLIEKYKKEVNDVKKESSIEVVKIREELIKKQKQVDELKQELERLQRESKRDQDTKEKIESNKKELEGLREYVYKISQEREDDMTEEEISLSDMISELSNIPTVVIGGNYNWVKRISPLFPKWKFVAVTANTFQKTIFTSSKLILVNDSCCSHSLYHRVMFAIESVKDAKLAYVGTYTNVYKTVKLFYDIAKEKDLL